MGPKPKFCEGEKVLCLHGPLIYEAKCLQSSVTEEKHVRYLIHYAGWNKTWDEWVPESRVLKYNNANVQRQKKMQRVHSAQPTKTKKTQAKGRKSETSNSATPVCEDSLASTPSCKDSKDNNCDDSSSDEPKKKHTKVEVNIKMPEELKVWLVDDWDMITQQKRLALLPAKCTVQQILDSYDIFKRSSKSHTPVKDSRLSDFTLGIREYFNTCLGHQLLYEFEREQYSDILHGYESQPMSNTYGAIHLVRLFSKMGPMLAYTSLNEASLQCILAYIQDFLKFMVTNRLTYFSLKDYATPECNSVTQGSK